MFVSNKILTAIELFLPNKKVIPSQQMISENINSLSNNALGPSYLMTVLAYLHLDVADKHSVMLHIWH